MISPSVVTRTDLFAAESGFEQSATTRPVIKERARKGAQGRRPRVSLPSVDFKREVTDIVEGPAYNKALLPSIDQQLADVDDEEGGLLYRTVISLPESPVKQVLHEGRSSCHSLEDQVVDANDLTSAMKVPCVVLTQAAKVEWEQYVRQVKETKLKSLGVGDDLAGRVARPNPLALKPSVRDLVSGLHTPSPSVQAALQAARSSTGVDAAHEPLPSNLSVGHATALEQQILELQEQQHKLSQSVSRLMDGQPLPEFRRVPPIMHQSERRAASAASGRDLVHRRLGSIQPVIMRSFSAASAASRRVTPCESIPEADNESAVTTSTDDVSIDIYIEDIAARKAADPTCPTTKTAEAVTHVELRNGAVPLRLEVERLASFDASATTKMHKHLRSLDMPELVSQRKPSILETHLAQLTLSAGIASSVAHGKGESIGRAVSFDWADETNEVGAPMFATLTQHDAPSMSTEFDLQGLAQLREAMRTPMMKELKDNEITAESQSWCYPVDPAAISFEYNPYHQYMVPVQMQPNQQLDAADVIMQALDPQHESSMIMYDELQPAYDADMVLYGENGAQVSSEEAESVTEESSFSGAEEEERNIATFRFPSNAPSTRSSPVKKQPSMDLSDSSLLECSRPLSAPPIGAASTPRKPQRIFNKSVGLPDAELDSIIMDLSVRDIDMAAYAEEEHEDDSDGQLFDDTHLSSLLPEQEQAATEYETADSSDLYDEPMSHGEATMLAQHAGEQSFQQLRRTSSRRTLVQQGDDADVALLLDAMLSAKLKGVNDAVYDIQRSLRKVERKLDGTHNAVESCRQSVDLSSFNRTASDMRGLMDGANGSDDELVRASLLKAELGAVKDKLASLSISTCGSVADHLEQHDAEQRKMWQEAEDLRQHCDAIEQEKAALKAQLVEAVSLTTVLQSQYSDSELSSARLRRERDNAQEKYGLLEQHLQDTAREVAERQASYEQELTSERDRRETLERDLTEARAAVNALEMTCDRLVSELKSRPSSIQLSGKGTSDTVFLQSRLNDVEEERQRNAIQYQTDLATKERRMDHLMQEWKDMTVTLAQSQAEQRSLQAELVQAADVEDRLRADLSRQDRTIDLLQRQFDEVAQRREHEKRDLMSQVYERDARIQQLEAMLATVTGQPLRSALRQPSPGWKSPPPIHLSVNSPPVALASSTGPPSVGVISPLQLHQPAAKRPPLASITSNMLSTPAAAGSFMAESDKENSPPTSIDSTLAQKDVKSPDMRFRKSIEGLRKLRLDFVQDKQISDVPPMPHVTPAVCTVIPTAGPVKVVQCEAPGIA
ncbi:hypothetical protein PYCC9005_003071 [Savitreella phatthalungensis]